MKEAYLKRLILATGLSLLGQLSISKAATNIFAQPGQEAPGTFLVGAEEENCRFELHSRQHLEARSIRCSVI